MSSSDSGLTAALCLACLVLTSMLKQYTKTQREISLCFRPKETHKQTYLSPVQWSTTKRRLFAECFKLLLFMSDPTVADTYFSKICAPPHPHSTPFLFSFFLFQFLLTFKLCVRCQINSKGPGVQIKRQIQARWKKAFCFSGSFFCCCSRWTRREPCASVAAEVLLGKGADGGGECFWLSSMDGISNRKRRACLVPDMNQLGWSEGTSGLGSY